MCVCGGGGAGNWVASIVKDLDSEEQLRRLVYKVAFKAKGLNGDDGEALRRGSTLTRMDRTGRGT